VVRIVQRLLVTLALIGLPARGAEQPLGWAAQTTSNPVQGGTIGIAIIDEGNVRASVRCESARTWDDVRFYVAESLATSTESVRWQFDQQKPQSGRWPASPNRGSLIVPAELQDRFIERLRAAGTLYLALTDGDGEEHSLVVPLRGSAAAIESAMKGCR
jgi:hypothetical protein